MISIAEVIHIAVTALFKNDILRRQLVLKGGAALHIKEGLKSRLSTDIDFSVSGQVEKPEDFFEVVGKAISTEFERHGFYIFDVEHGPKPKNRSPDLPNFWSGWFFRFKFIALEKKDLPAEDRSRGAITPTGSNSPKIEIEISEYEYCGSKEEITLEGASIASYSSHAIIAEKIRAICQQHPDYKFASNKGRARDYFDIFKLSQKYRSKANFYEDLAAVIPSIFSAKEVPVEIMGKIFSEEFSKVQADNFSQVKGTVKESLEPFSYYEEQLKLLIQRLRPHLPG